MARFKKSIQTFTISNFRIQLTVIPLGTMQNKKRLKGAQVQPQPAWNKLKDYFLANLINGIVLSTSELEKYCKQRKWQVDPTKLKKIRRYWKFTAIFEPLLKKPKYMSASILKYGTAMLDIGFIPKYKSSNKNFTAFLVGKEIVSGAIAAVEIKTKSMQDIYEGIKTILSRGAFQQIHTLCWDREAAVRSQTFQKQLYTNFGVRVFYLTQRSKAYFAENAIKYIKKRIGMKIEASGDKKWIGSTLQNICQPYNNQKVPGTTFTRASITRKNTTKFLAQKFKLKSPTLLFNSAVLNDSSFTNKTWRRRIFKFEKGDKVLIAKRANAIDNFETSKISSKKKRIDPPYKQMSPLKSGSKSFLKTSLTGQYSKTVYTIDKRSLKSSNHFYWAIVYTLKEMPNTFWYQS